MCPKLLSSLETNQRARQDLKGKTIKQYLHIYTAVPQLENREATSTTTRKKPALWTVRAGWGSHRQGWQADDITDRVTGHRIHQNGKDVHSTCAPYWLGQESALHSDPRWETLSNRSVPGGVQGCQSSSPKSSEGFAPTISNFLTPTGYSTIWHNSDPIYLKTGSAPTVWNFSPTKLTLTSGANHKSRR